MFVYIRFLTFLRIKIWINYCFVKTKDMDGLTLAGNFSEFALIYHIEEVVKILKNPDENQHFSIVVNFVTLFDDNSQLGNGILTEPEKYLSICDQGLIIAQRNLLQRFQNDNSQVEYKIKTKVHVRITAIPCSELYRATLPRNDDIGDFLKISGTIVKVTAPKLLEFQRDYKCVKCQYVATIKADYELHYIFMPPAKCANDCSNSSFKPSKSTDQSNYKDYQEVKIQEQVGQLNIGNMPQSMWVTLEDDLVDSCKPGDDVAIWGTVMRRWKPPNVGTKCNIEIVLKANNLQICNDQKSSALVNDEMKEAFDKFWKAYEFQPLLGRNHILESFCPQVYGLYIVKLSVAIILAGGVEKSDEEGGSKVRGNSHLLLVGDPGTGKSHLLRFAARICSRSVLTTGVGSTTAGLTVSAVREGGDWQLEAGALVLSDGGICCIDEFNSIREHDRTSIHEAMEQQTISVAKAGMVTKMNTRCSILAATNPKGNYDSEVPMSVNISLASPLLSRFDLVLVLLDSRNSDWDRLVSSFILEGGKNPFVSQVNNSTVNTQQLETDIWSIDKLQFYFSLIRTINPIMTKEANIVLSKYYQAQRMADSRNVARTTVRMLESLVRLSQGHARLMYREQVTLQDAIVAVCLVESSMQTSALIGGINALHSAFPQNPYREYKSSVELILKKLKLEDLLQQEFVNLKQQDEVMGKHSGLPSESPTTIAENPENPGNKEKESKAQLSQRINEILTCIRKTKDKNTYDLVNYNKKNEPKATKKRTVKDKKQSNVRNAKKSNLISSGSESEENKDEGFSVEKGLLDISCLNTDNEEASETEEPVKKIDSDVDLFCQSDEEAPSSSLRNQNFDPSGNDKSSTENSEYKNGNTKQNLMPNKGIEILDDIEKNENSRIITPKVGSSEKEKEKQNITVNESITSSSSKVKQKTLDKLSKFKRIEKETGQNEENKNGTIDYGSIKNLAKLGKILSQQNCEETEKSIHTRHEKKKDSKVNLSQNVFTLEEMDWNDVDLDL